MSGRKSLGKVFKDYDDKKQDRYPILPGRLGIIDGGVEVVEVPDRDAFVWVRLRGHTSELIQAYNTVVSPVYNLPVLVTRDEIDPRTYRIIGRDTATYNNWGNTAYLPKHATQHTFPSEAYGTGGGDIVWVQGQQFYPLLAVPSGTYGYGGVVVEPYLYYDGDSWAYLCQTGTANLLSYKPTGTTTSRMVLLYLNKDTHVFGYVGGNEFDATLTGTAQIFSYIPAIPTTNDIPIAAVRLLTGTSTLKWANIYDVRPFFSAQGVGGGGSGATGTITVHEDGVFVQDAAILDFYGHLNVTTAGSTAEIRLDGFTDEQLIWGNASGELGSDAYLVYEDASKALMLWDTDSTTRHWWRPGRWDVIRMGTNPYILGWFARNNAGNPDSPNADDILFRLSALGWITGSWPTISNARVDLVAETDWDGDNHPTRIDFYTTPTGTVSSEVITQFGSSESMFLKGIRASSYVLITGTYYAQPDDFMLMVSCDLASIDVYLPPASMLGKIMFFKILAVNGNTVSLHGYGGDTIDGLAQHDLVDQYNRMILWADGGTNWYIMCQQ